MNDIYIEYTEYTEKCIPYYGPFNLYLWLEDEYYQRFTIDMRYILRNGDDDDTF